MITQSQLKEILAYNPETGIFTWRKSIGKRAVVGEEPGFVTSSGYRIIKLYRCQYFAHQLAFLYMTGEIPGCCDHINRVKTDNRWVNLRPATREQNGANRPANANNKSGYKGVHWNTQNKKWVAQVTVNGRRKFLGYFTDKKKASQAYIEAAKELYGEFASL